DLGVCGGFASEPSAEMIRAADVVLAVGAGLNQFTTGFNTQFNETARIIQIELGDEPTNPEVELFIECDANQASTQLLELLVGHTAPDRPWNGVAEHARDSRLTFDRDTGTGQAPDGRLDPRSVMH